MKNILKRTLNLFTLISGLAVIGSIFEFIVNDREFDLIFIWLFALVFIVAINYIFFGAVTAWHRFYTDNEHH